MLKLQKLVTPTDSTLFFYKYKKTGEKAFGLRKTLFIRWLSKSRHWLCWNQRCNDCWSLPGTWTQWNTNKLTQHINWIGFPSTAWFCGLFISGFLLICKTKFTSRATVPDPTPCHSSPVLLGVPHNVPLHLSWHEQHMHKTWSRRGHERLWPHKRLTEISMHLCS